MIAPDGLPVCGPLRCYCINYRLTPARRSGGQCRHSCGQCPATCDGIIPAILRTQPPTPQRQRYHRSGETSGKTSGHRRPTPTYARQNIPAHRPAKAKNPPEKPPARLASQSDVFRLCNKRPVVWRQSPVLPFACSRGALPPFAGKKAKRIEKYKKRNKKRCFYKKNMIISK